MFFTKKKKPAQSARGTPKPSSAEPSFIGRNCVFEGHISCDGELHIDGTVRGTVQANLCVIDEAGVVQGTVNGQVVHVRGRILGPIQGANVFIHAGAHVEGDVFNDTISIENGAYVFGSIRHNTAPPPAPAQPSLLNGASSGDLSPDTANKLRVISNRK
jgi:cytoskeletal protein CcmA (bactofilin family)